MDGSRGGDPLINSFSLVAYLPEPLASFVNTLRWEIEPGCSSRSHLTALPPRHIVAATSQAISEIETNLKDWEAFEVSLENVEVFPVSKVIHLSIGHGSEALLHLHRQLNRGALGFQEVFHYHPHVTLAQALPPDQVERITALATERWRDYGQARSFLLDRLTLVQNTEAHGWQNLHEIFLRSPVRV
ncbi:MAG: 2'-5' RNA ligase family protein [Acidobacteriota bacterium]